MTNFVEIVINSSDFANAGFGGRDEIEDPLDDALSSSGLGKVSGGGSGMGEDIIDVDLYDAVDFNRALDLIRHTLQSLKVPRSTVIICYEPVERAYDVYEPLPPQ